MEFLQKVLDWLATFPLWQENESLHLEEMGYLPGDVTVRQEGMVTRNRWADITGRVSRRARIVLGLRKVCGMPDERDAAWLLEFQQWVAKESELHRAPRIGFDSVWFAEAGKMDGSVGAGTGVAGVRLINEFTVVMTEEEWEEHLHGEN